MSNIAVYVKHRSGAMHVLGFRRTTKLRKEILAGRGGPQVLELVEAGYSGFLGDSGDVEDFENLEAHFKTHGLSA
jgi:hypothetical protein